MYGMLSDGIPAEGQEPLKAAPSTPFQSEIVSADTLRLLLTDKSKLPRKNEFMSIPGGSSKSSNSAKEDYYSELKPYCEPQFHDYVRKFKKDDFWVDETTDTCLDSCILMPESKTIEPKFYQFEEYCRFTADRPDFAVSGPTWSHDCRDWFECMFGCEVFGSDREKIRGIEDLTLRKQLLDDTIPDIDYGAERFCAVHECRSYCANKAFKSTCKKFQYRQECERELGKAQSPLKFCNNDHGNLCSSAVRNFGGNRVVNFLGNKLYSYSIEGDVGRFVMSIVILWVIVLHVVG